jgi:hypothetical protein
MSYPWANSRAAASHVLGLVCRCPLACGRPGSLTIAFGSNITPASSTSGGAAPTLLTRASGSPGASPHLGFGAKEARRPRAAWSAAATSLCCAATGASMPVREPPVSRTVPDADAGIFRAASSAGRKRVLHALWTLAPLHRWVVRGCPGTNPVGRSAKLSLSLAPVRASAPWLRNGSTVPTQPGIALSEEPS